MSKIIGPMSPADIAAVKTAVIPNEVFDVFNELIAKNFTSGYATIKQEDAISLIIERIPGSSRSKVFSQGWLNVEEAYREKGWSVKYDKPDYTESYPSTFEFRVKK